MDDCVKCIQMGNRNSSRHLWRFDDGVGVRSQHTSRGYVLTLQGSERGGGGEAVPCRVC